MLLSPDALHCLKRKQLTSLCTRFGIKAVGKNADLIQRLQDYAACNIPPDSPTKGNLPVLRHVKRPRQSDSSLESSGDPQHIHQQPSSPLPPLTPRTRRKRISDLAQAIQEVTHRTDDMDTDDQDQDPGSSQKNTIAFPISSTAPASMLPSPSPPWVSDMAEPTQPLRIIKALPSSSHIASPLSTETILEMSRPTKQSPLAAPVSSSLYPDLSSLLLPQGVASDCLTSSSTLPSVTSRQFSAAAATVLAEMNARLTAAGRSTTSGSLATMSSMGNGAWQTLAASASTQGMSNSRSGRYEIHHERQFRKMDSIVNHYAARRIGGRPIEKGADNATLAESTSAAASNAVMMPSSASASRRSLRVDASTSTRSLAAVARSTSTRKMPIQRRPLPVPPTWQAKLPPTLNTAVPATKKTIQMPQTSNAEPPRAKRLRLAVTEDQDALQNTVLDIPPEKKTVVIRVTRPEREGMPYKFSVASSSDGKATSETNPVRAASSLRKTVIKATKGTFVRGGSAKKTLSAHTQKREAAFAKQQQQQAAMSRSISSRANLADSPAEGMTTSTSARNKFTGVVTTLPLGNKPAVAISAKIDSTSSVRKASVAESAISGTSACLSEASKNTNASSRFGGSIRSSVSQGLGKAEAARQARLKEIKARTKAALAGFGSQRSSVASTTATSTDSTSTNTDDAASPRKALPAGQAFSPSVTRPTLASLGRAVSNASGGRSGSASLPMLSAMRQAPLNTANGLDGVIANGLQRAATVHAGVGKVLTPCLTPRSSSLRHLRRMMRKQQKEANLEQVRIVAAENIAPGAVVPSVVPQQAQGAEEQGKPSIRTVATRAAPSPDKYTTLPAKTKQRPAGPRPALVTTRATTSALNQY